MVILRSFIGLLLVVTVTPAPSTLPLGWEEQPFEYLTNRFRQGSSFPFPLTCSKNESMEWTKFTVTIDVQAPDPIPINNIRVTCSTTFDGYYICLTEYQHDNGTFQPVPQTINKKFLKNMEQLKQQIILVPLMVVILLVGVFLLIDIWWSGVWKLDSHPPGTHLRNKWLRYFYKKLGQMF